MAIRDMNGAADLFLEAVLTFGAYELMNYEELIFYAVITSVCVSPHLTNYNKEITHLNTCCENKLFSPTTTTTNFFQTNTSSNCQLNISTKNNFNNNNFFANKKKSLKKRVAIIYF
uniref:26S proteasome regulatory subunit Rpn7 N-terminal domain-containing protein n=1 Tax=Meloidogyne enterolobii TaxID=390850 RepID=A0A6V7WAK8_MELEN|nr:unnamed protein product [Meloidogyne enterolobii]